MPKKDLDDDISRLLKTIVDHFDKEDRATRELQIRHYRRLKLYWNNFSQVYWSEVAHDYKVFGQNGASIAGNAGDDQDYYDKPVNVFKAFLETIIAALSVQIPGIECAPDDADSPLDMSTKKAGDKIAELLYKHNNATFLWLNALYVYCTEGMIACQIYTDEDKKYGTYKKKRYQNEEVENYVCPSCGVRVPDEVFTAQQMNKFDPGPEDAELHDEIEELEAPICFECGVALDPDLQKTKLTIPRLVGNTDEAKSRVCLKVYGGLYVKIANYAKEQCDTPYLIFSHETHYANVLEEYPDLKSKIPQGSWANMGTGMEDPYEQYGRLNTQYRGEFPLENVTVKNSWLRPASFNILPEDDCNKLKQKFPDGCRCVFVNSTCAEYENEALDDHWVLSQNPMSDFLTHDPLGELLTNVQDIVNDLISLTLQTIEHGIAQTWADPAVVNFHAQSQIEAMPGTLSATKPVSGSKNVAEAFYTTKSAALSPEVFNFYRIVQELGQFVSGALPSLFGGQQGAGSSSRTASEYAMSKGMAMQRLQTPWKMMTIWWKEIFALAIPAYMECIRKTEDERIVQKDKNGNFVNVFIRKAELDGKIGSIELEADGKLPVTDEQQADMILQLMQLNNAEIMQSLMDPQNFPYLKKVIKIPGFKLPGEDDRQKQNEEIVRLLNEEPILGMPDEQIQAEALATGIPLEPTEDPSVAIDVDVDNHIVEGSICRSWLVSDAGRLAKIENPAGYQNVLLHMKAHVMQVQLNMMQQQMQQQEQDPNAPSADSNKKANGSKEPKPNNSGSAPPAKPKQPEKITEESNARSPIA